MGKKSTMNILKAYDANTNELLEKYCSIKHVCFCNKDYNYYGLKQAIYNNKPYRGVYYEWETIEI